MGDESEWQKLPTDEKCQHKAWKARMAGYEEACKLFDQITDEKSPEFSKYAGLMKKFVTDNNAIAQEKALDAVTSYVTNAFAATKIAHDVLQGIITKCLNASRQKTKEKAVEIIMLYIEIEKQDVVQECLLAGLDNKQPKVVVGCIQAMCMALRDFGNKIMPIKPVVPRLSKLLEDRDKNIREETKQFIIEIYRWIKQAIKPHMASFKPVQVTELEAEFEKIGSEKPQQNRFLRSQEDARAKMEMEAASGGGGGEVDGGADDAGDEDLDPYEMLPATDVLAGLPKDFYEKIEAKKWQERKEALEALQKLAQSPKIEGGDFGQLMRAVLKVIGKDSNVMLVTIGAKCAAGIATGLRKKFSPYAVSTIQCVLEKFKEKKQAVVAALREAIDAAYFATNLEAISEDCIANLENKNPSMKAEGAAFLGRCFAKSTMGTLPKKLLKLFCTSLLKTVNDTAPEVREASFIAIGTAMKVVSEKHIMPFLTDVDSIKMQKIQECCTNAVLLNARGEPRAGGGGGGGGGGATAAPPKGSVPKPVQRPATGKTGGASTASKGSGRPQTAASAGGKSSGGGKKSPTKGKGGKKGGTDSKGEATEPVLSDEALEEKAEMMFTGEVLKQLESANWKERLAGMERVIDIVKGLSKEELKCQVVIRVLGKKPGLKDNNFQVLKAKVDAVAHVAKNGVFTKVTVGYCLPDLVDKIGDMKNGGAVREAISCIAEAISLEYVSKEVILSAFEQKNPKNQSEALNWLANALKEFGLKINAKLIIESVKKAFAATNPAIRNAAIALVGVMYMYMGQNLRMLFEGEKPALLQQIDAEIEKVKGEKPPPPVRGVAPAGADEEDEDDDEDKGGDEMNMEDLVTRVDIGEKFSPELMNEIADKNWKVRKEALEKVTAILNEAGFITGNLGPLPEALKVRLGDNNKVLVSVVLGILTTLGTKLGVQCRHHFKTVGPALITCCGDSKPQLRAAAVGALNIWVEHCSLTPLVECEALNDALKLENPNLRQELLGWLTEKLPTHKQLPTEFKACVPHVLACLEDRSGDVRKKAGDALVPFMIHVGYETFFRATSKLKPASKDQILAVIEKAKANVPVKPKKTKSAPAKVEVEDEPKAPSRPPSTAMSDGGGGGGESKPATKTVKSKGKAAPPPTSKSKKKEEDTGPLMTLTVPKEKRFKDEKSLKVLKWNFIELTGEFVEQLKLQMEKNFSKTMMEMMYHSDFKMHTKAIEALIKAMDSLQDETIGNLDLLLKWFTIRFLDTNPSMLNKALEYLRRIFTMLAEVDYHLHEYEASSFVPYLILKVGEPKDNVRREVREIFKLMYKVYPASKIFSFLIDGLKSKNSKQRMECLEELGNLIESYGITICQPSPAAALKVIVGQIGDRDTGVRNAALNTAVQVYLILGEQQFYKFSGSMSDKDQSLLDERIKRSLKNKSNKPAPKAEERPRTVPSQPQRSASQSVIQRPGTSVPKSASSNSVKNEFVLDFDDEGPTHVEMPKLYQVDYDELFQPVEMPKMKPRDPSPMRRVNPVDASAAIGMVIAQITNSECLTCIQALSQIDELLKDENRSEVLESHVDQLLLHISMKLRMVFSTNMNGPESGAEDVVRLYRCLLGTLFALFKNLSLATKGSKYILKDLVNSLVTILLDERLNNLEEGPQVIRSVNVMVVKIVEKSDHTSILCALIRLLQECIASETCSTKFLELIMKCIWKMVKMLPEIINDLSVENILLEIHIFLKAFPSHTWKAQGSDVPLRTVKTVIHTLAMLKGAKILNHMNLIDSSENSEVKAFLQKSLRNNPNTRNEMNGGADEQESKKNNQKPKKLNKSTHDMLAEIFKKIGSKENTREGLNNLYDFKKKHPEADLDPFLRKSSQFFQNYIERGLRTIELEREGKVSDGGGITMQDSAPKVSNDDDPASGDDHVDINYYKERLRVLRARCGLENVEAPKQETIMSKQEEKEDKNQGFDIFMKTLETEKSEPEEPPPPPQQPAASTDVSELKMRLERIKKLAKS